MYTLWGRQTPPEKVSVLIITDIYSFVKPKTQDIVFFQKNIFIKTQDIVWFWWKYSKLAYNTPLSFVYFFFFGCILVFFHHYILYFAPLYVVVQKRTSCLFNKMFRNIYYIIIYDYIRFSVKWSWWFIYECNGFTPEISYEGCGRINRQRSADYYK